MRAVSTCVCFLIGVWLLQCSPVVVTYTNQIEGKSLSAYDSFAFSEVDVDNQANWETQADNLERIKDLIAEELEARGIEQTTGDPDLRVNLGVVITDEVQTRETDIREAPRYIGTRRYHWESEEIVVREYQEGTLMMDVVDTRAGEMIWQSAVKSTLTKHQEKMEKRIDAAVAELFKTFPS